MIFIGECIGMLRCSLKFCVSAPEGRDAVLKALTCTEYSMGGWLAQHIETE